jgi:hypothetical protein
MLSLRTLLESSGSPRRQLLRRQVVSAALLVSMLLTMLLSALPFAPAAVAAPALPALQPASAPVEAEAAPASADAILNIANVAAPNINCFFDSDCTITVSDMASNFVPPGAIGNGFLQSRTWPVGMAGTPGQDQYAYLYRIDLRNATAVTGQACVTGMSINFGPIVANDYNGDAKPDHVFVVSAGGLGSIAPATAVQSGDVVTFRFQPAICPGTRPGGGQSSFFFGMASKAPEQVVVANLTGTLGLAAALKAKAPRPAAPAPGCYEIKSPTEIPAPALVDFDDLPDAATIGAHYQPTHGLTFFTGKETNVITYGDRDADPTKSRSKPNVATNSAVFPTTSENIPLTFRFDTGKTHVGFYMGNGETAGLAGAMVGYDAAGNVICQVTNTPVPERYEEFIGMFDPAGRIVLVTLNYGASLLSESIDDLYFAPGGAGPLAAPTTPLFGDGSEGVRVDVGKSDNTGFQATIVFPKAQFVAADGPDGRDYLQYLMPGIDPNSSAEAGLPEVPVFRSLLAAPRGAKLRVASAQPQAGLPLQGLLLPAQPSPADQKPPHNEDGDFDPADFADLPFVRSDEAYRSAGPFPPQPVSVTYMGAVRDLEIWQVSVAGGSYNPAKGEILPYNAMAVEIAFEGGSGGFLPDSRQQNAFDGNGNPLFDDDGGGGLNPLYAGVLNRAVLRDYLYQGPIIVNPICWGSEFLIVTDPAFRPAADALRAWKNSKGISTSVVETGNGAGQAGDTALEIRQFVKNRYDNCMVRPSYLLLLGDAEFIPPFYRSTHYGDLAGTDLDYSLMAGADTLPDLAYGRIPVDTLTSANTVINKIIAYEDTPPVAPAFYDNVTVASYFQCCRPEVAQDGTDSRSFVETSELIRSHLLGRGYGVERIYNTNTDYHSGPTEESFYNAATRSTTPNRYYNGALLPAALRASSGYAWDGDGADVINAFNAGRFLILHRDHGGINGWGDPGFGTGNLGSLTNGALTPVVYSINCASGLWDNETRSAANDFYTYNTSNGGTYWAEAILRQNGGAVGVIGDTRNSPTWANSALARGLIDATWYNLVPGFGSSSTLRRLGDILNHGKLYMLGQVGVAQTAGSVTQNQANTNNTLYHVIGDPTLTMWTYDPHQIILPPWVLTKAITAKIWTLRYPVNGAVITALQGETPIARGRVANGEVELVLLGDGSVFNPKLPLELSAQLPDGQSTPLGIRSQVGAFDPATGGKLADEGVKFDLPAGAFDTPLTLFFQKQFTPTAPLPPTVAGLDFVALDAFADNGDEVEKFKKVWTLEFAYADDELGGKSEDGLACRYFDEKTGQWESVPSSVDKTGNKVICRADHFTEFALVAGDPPLPPSTFIYLPVVNGK